MDRPMELRHLAQADRHLCEGRLRIERQAAMVEALRARHADTRAAEALLDMLQSTLAQWEIHRGMIAEALDS